MPRHHVHDNLFIRGARLIIGSPATINEFELPPFDQPPDLCPRRLILQVPPPLKEIHLGLREPPLRVLLERLHDRRDYLLDPLEKVLLGWHLPAHVIVRVTNQVHLDLPRVYHRVTFSWHDCCCTL